MCPNAYRPCCGAWAPLPSHRADGGRVAVCSDPRVRSWGQLSPSGKDAVSGKGFPGLRAAGAESGSPPAEGQLGCRARPACPLPDALAGGRDGLGPEDASRVRGHGGRPRWVGPRPWGTCVDADPACAFAVIPAGWESQLLETGFLGIFLCPLWTLSRLPRGTPPSRIVLWGFRWLIFRIMLGAVSRTFICCVSGKHCLGGGAPSAVPVFPVFKHLKHHGPPPFLWNGSQLTGGVSGQLHLCPLPSWSFWSA